MSIPRKLYVNVYAPFAGQIGTAYATRELAEQMAARGRLACIEVDVLRGSAVICGGHAASFIEVATK